MSPASEMRGRWHSRQQKAAQIISLTLSLQISLHFLTALPYKPPSGLTLTALGAAEYVSLFLRLGVSGADLVPQLTETLALNGPAASAALVWLWITKKPATCQVVLWTSVAIVAGGLAALGACEISIILVSVSLALDFIVRRAVMR